MTVTNSIYQTNELAADGVNRTWPYAFRVDDIADMRLEITDVDAVVTIVSTGFTATGVGSKAAAGVVTYPVSNDDDPVPAGWTVRVYRATALTQPARIGNEGPFSPQTHERALDRLTMIAQETRGRMAAVLDLGEDLGEAVAAAEDAAEAALLSKNAAASSAASANTAATNAAASAAEISDMLAGEGGGEIPGLAGIVVNTPIAARPGGREQSLIDWEREREIVDRYSDGTGNPANDTAAMRTALAACVGTGKRPQLTRPFTLNESILVNQWNGGFDGIGLGSYLTVAPGAAGLPTQVEPNFPGENWQPYTKNCVFFLGPAGGRYEFNNIAFLGVPSALTTGYGESGSGSAPPVLPALVDVFRVAAQWDTLPVTIRGLKAFDCYSPCTWLWGDVPNFTDWDVVRAVKVADFRNNAMNGRISHIRSHASGGIKVFHDPGYANLGLLRDASCQAGAAQQMEGTQFIDVNLVQATAEVHGVDVTIDPLFWMHGGTANSMSHLMLNEVVSGCGLKLSAVNAALSLITVHDLWFNPNGRVASNDRNLLTDGIQMVGHVYDCRIHDFAIVNARGYGIKLDGQPANILRNVFSDGLITNPSGGAMARPGTHSDMAHLGPVQYNEFRKVRFDGGTPIVESGQSRNLYDASCQFGATPTLNPNSRRMTKTGGTPWYQDGADLAF